MQIIFLSRLLETYPPTDHYIAESQEIKDYWGNHLATNPQSDPRTTGDKRHPVHLLVPSKLQYVVKEGESISFVDPNNGRTRLGVVQGLIGDRELVSNLNGTVLDHLNKSKSLMRVCSPHHVLFRSRLLDLSNFSFQAEHPGKMSGVGYSSGQRSSRKFAWAKNIKDNVDVDAHAYKMSCFFAHVWNLGAKVLPKEVLDDFEEASKRLSGMKMDAGQFGRGDGVLRYSMNIGGREVKFETKGKHRAVDWRR